MLKGILNKTLSLLFLILFSAACVADRLNFKDGHETITIQKSVDTKKYFLLGGGCRIMFYKNVPWLNHIKSAQLRNFYNTLPNLQEDIVDGRNQLMTRVYDISSDGAASKSLFRSKTGWFLMEMSSYSPNCLETVPNESYAKKFGEKLDQNGISKNYLGVSFSDDIDTLSKKLNQYGGELLYNRDPVTGNLYLTLLDHGNMSFPFVKGAVFEQLVATFGEDDLMLLEARYRIVDRNSAYTSSRNIARSLSAQYLNDGGFEGDAEDHYLVKFVDGDIDVQLANNYPKFANDGRFILRYYRTATDSDEIRLAKNYVSEHRHLMNTKSLMHSSTNIKF